MKYIFLLIISILLFTAGCKSSKVITLESVSPNIFVKDIQQTIELYKQMGFELAMTVPDKQPYDWAMMSFGNVTFMFQTFKSLGDELPEIKREDGGSLLLYVKVKNIGELYGKIKSKVQVIKYPEKTFYGTTEFSVRDNNGYVITFAEDVE